MPYVNIQITDEGVTRENKAALIEQTTRMLQEVLGKKPSSTHVVIDIVATDNWGVGGRLVTDIRAEEAKK